MHGWEPLIVCGVEGKPECDFDQLMILANNLINDLILLSTLIAVAVFAFGGIKLLTSGGNENAMKQTKEMLRKVLVGYLWVLAAWVLIYTLMNVLLDDGYTNLLTSPN